MPAIDLARLKKQTAQLADQFNDPEAFVRKLRDLLDHYVNRTVREDGKVAPSSTLETFRTPPPVLRQIENELAPLAASQPDETLEIADRLWDEGWLEMRILAAALLGRIQPQEERLLARLTAWTGQVRDPSVRAALLTTSLARLRRETPDRFLELIGEWLNPKRQQLWPQGIQALIPLIRDPEYKNLPPIFDLLENAVETSPPLIQSDLIDLFHALDEVSPTEAAHFLRQVLENAKSPSALITFRRISPSLPNELAEAARDLLKRKPQPENSNEEPH